MSAHVLSPFRWLWRKVRDALRPVNDNDGLSVEILPPGTISQSEYQQAFEQSAFNTSVRNANNPARYVEPAFQWKELRAVVVADKPAFTGRCRGCGAAVPGPDFLCSEHCLNG